MPFTFQVSKRQKLVAATVMATAGVLPLGYWYHSRPNTPGERFDAYIERWTRICKSYRPSPGDVTCDFLKLKPYDPLATPEGRFAHSIVIPNPVPADSGYRKGMTPNEYLDTLCKVEAGVFVYSRIANVQGLLIMRPRGFDSNSANHLYAPEAPFLLSQDVVPNFPARYLGSQKYQFIETERPLPIAIGWHQRLHPSLLSVNATQDQTDIFRYFGYDEKSDKSLQVLRTRKRLSQYGFTWRGISRPHDRELGIGGGELLILDLDSRRVIGMMRGYARFEIDERHGRSSFNWTLRCPRIANEAYLQERRFLMDVLSPAVAGVPEGKNADGN